MASGACSGKVALTFHRSVIPNSSRENPFEPEKDRFERGDSNGKYMCIYICLTKNVDNKKDQKERNMVSYCNITTNERRHGIR